MFYINNVDIFTLFHRDQYMIFVLIQKPICSSGDSEAESEIMMIFVVVLVFRKLSTLWNIDITIG